jgi:hypothetical protein
LSGVGKALQLTRAQIAAAGVQPLIVQGSNSASNNKQEFDAAHSSAQDDMTTHTQSNGSAPPPAAAKHKKLVELAQRGQKDTGDSNMNGTLASKASPHRSGEVHDGPVLLVGSDDIGTQVSSSSGSNKPQSVDGKSVASGTTFALDEKESLRPDDSASVKAVEDDDAFSIQGNGLAGSRIGSDDGVRAFRDQLREISSMEPARNSGPPQQFGNAPKGVLYVPPQGPGIGAVPNAARNSAEGSPMADYPPDQKLLDALDNPRDRVWVLKLEQDVIDFVKDAKEASLTLPQCHAFYRLLAHKMADYYMLGHLVDDSTSAVRLYKTPNCRIPPPLTGITAPSTAASTPPPSGPKMTILQRGSGPAIANGSNMPSKSGSENDSDDDKKKAPVTREQREARYEAARLRIMGSAKPSDSSETPKENQESRSSSVAGRKNRRKPRADSDDGFEARSAYSNFYAPSFGSEGVSTPYAPYSEYSDSAGGQYSNAYHQQMHAGGPHQMNMQGPANPNWAHQQFQSVHSTQAWAQGQSGAYDLNADFQRMSFQSQVPNQGQPPNANPYYNQQFYDAQQAWSSQPQQSQQHLQQPPPTQAQQFSAQSQPPPSSHPYGSNHHLTPTGSMQDPHQSYPFGQLPSQTFPGRPASKSEHPLPGSYKSKHFNPQSQSFIPGQANGRTFSPQGTPPAPTYAFPNAYGPQSQLHRQPSAQSPSPGFGSPHSSSPHLMQSRMPIQPMTHPLPQGPVFPRQPSPNVPLPPKPTISSQRAVDQAAAPSPSAHTQHMHGQSLLAKWGAPPSLPAKPPPSVEPFDGTRLAQAQRQPFNAAAAARQPGAYSSYGPGSMQIVNGSGRALGSQDEPRR